MRTTVLDAYHRVLAPRLRIVRLIPAAGPGLVAGMVTGSVVLGALPVVFIVETSVMLGRVPAAVSGGTASPAWGRLVTAFVVAAAAFVAQQILAPVYTSLGELVSRRVDGVVAQRLMHACLRTPGVAPLEDQAILDELSEASRQLEDGFLSPGRACAGLLALVARYVELAGCAVVVAVVFSPLAAVVLVTATMVFRYGQRGGLRRYSVVFQTVRTSVREGFYLRDLAIEASAGKEIRIFGLGDWLHERYRWAYLSWLTPVWAKRRQVYLWPHLAFTGFGLLAATALLATAGVRAAGSLPLASLALVLQAVLAGLRLGDYYPESDVQTQFGMHAYDAVHAVEQGMRRYDAPPPAPPGALVPVAARHPTESIRFERVSFGYPGQQRPVFDQLDLTIPANRCVALVGVNGAGKTTLVKLLTRLHEPQGGRLIVDGTDIRSFPVEDWRARIGVIFQTFNRYELSAADNIGLGGVERLHDTDRIREAAKMAGILEALQRLPRGLDTPLARHLPGGVELSGGQWQRVALARALYALDNGASILVLDEPTASLDVRAEARFFDEFVSLTAGVTTLLISHRFSTVRHADLIAVLEDGRVVEQGTHDALLAKGGRYATMFHLQAQRFSEDEEDDR